MEIKQNLRVIEFYSYPTAVCEPIEQYSEREKTPRGDSKVMSLFLACLDVAEKKLNKHLSDNKIAMKVQYTCGPLKTEFFVGYKDLVWTMGQSLNPYMTGHCEKIEEDL